MDKKRIVIAILAAVALGGCIIAVRHNREAAKPVAALNQLKNMTFQQLNEMTPKQLDELFKQINKLTPEQLDELFKQTDESAKKLVEQMFGASITSITGPRTKINL